MKTRDLRRKTGNLAVPSPSQASSFIAGRLRSRPIKIPFVTCSELLASCVCDATAVKPREGDVKGKKLLRFLALMQEWFNIQRFIHAVSHINLTNGSTPLDHLR